MCNYASQWNLDSLEFLFFIKWSYSFDDVNIILIL